jgi:hypothetical protein
MAERGNHAALYSP